MGVKLGEASPIAATRARTGFSSLGCAVESAARLRDEIANTTSVITKRGWIECVIAVWDFAAVSNQNLVRSRFKKKKLSHR
jgi:hypothetical protein